MTLGTDSILGYHRHYCNKAVGQTTEEVGYNSQYEQRFFSSPHSSYLSQDVPNILFFLILFNVYE